MIDGPLGAGPNLDLNHLLYLVLQVTEANRDCPSVKSRRHVSTLQLILEGSQGSIGGFFPQLFLDGPSSLDLLQGRGSTTRPISHLAQESKRHVSSVSFPTDRRWLLRSRYRRNNDINICFRLAAKTGCSVRFISLVQELHNTTELLQAVMPPIWNFKS